MTEMPKRPAYKNAASNSISTYGFVIDCLKEKQVL